MKLLLCEWAAYMQEDLRLCLKKMQIEFREIGYCFVDLENDDYFDRNFRRIIGEEHYDAVMSMNYFPVIAKVCHEKKVPYIAWVYDCPINIREPEKTLGFPTNHVFFFDQDEYRQYKKMGFDTVHHMELAVNCARLDELRVTEAQIEKYSADISFIGSMYETEFAMFYARIPEYYKGYVNAIISAQSKVYGAYMIRDVLKKEHVTEMKKCMLDLSKFQGVDDNTFKKWLNNMLASEITRRERITILSLLSRRYQVKLYSHGEEKMLPDVEYCGTADSFLEAPKIFNLSKINLNVTLKEITSGMSLRIFDILGAGGFLLTNWQKEIAENFVDGEEVVMYSSIEDAIGKANYYLAHEEERIRIAANGRKAVERFSFENQLARIFKIALG